MGVVVGIGVTVGVEVGVRVSVGVGEGVGVNETVGVEVGSKGAFVPASQPASINKQAKRSNALK
jgi:hypothetical protein